MNIQWQRPQKSHLAVRCRKCHSPIPFAVDHSDGSPALQDAKAGLLVLTCSSNACNHKADYTDAAVFRHKQSPADFNRSTSGTGGKTAKRKG